MVKVLFCHERIGIIMKKANGTRIRRRSRDTREAMRLEEKLATMNGAEIRRGLLDDIDWTTASLSGLASYSFLLMILTF
jgi:hypothetical protein